MVNKYRLNYLPIWRKPLPWIVVYFILAIYLYSIPGIAIIAGKGKNINLYDIWILIGLGYTLFGVLLSLNLKARSIIGFILLSQVVLSFLLQQFIVEYTGSIFYSEAVDALLYSKLAMVTKDLPLDKALDVINQRLGSISDLGGPIFLRAIYIIGGNVENSMRLLVVVNVILQTISAYYTYKLSEIIFKSKIVSKLTLAFWGCNMCSVFLNISGLKEPLFCMICTITMYHIFVYHKDRTLKNFLLFLLFVTLTSFFRYYITIFFLIIFIAYNNFYKLFTKYIVFWCVISITIVLVFSEILVYFMPELSFAIDMVEASKPHGLTLYVFYILSFLSPIPKFFSIDSTSSIIVSSYSYVKFSFSIFAIIGSYYFIKNKKTSTYPLILMSLFSTLLLIFAGAYIDYRFSYITMPSFYVLMFGGAKVYRKKVLPISYLLLTGIIIYMFNMGTYK